MITKSFWKGWLGFAFVFTVLLSCKTEKDNILNGPPVSQISVDKIVVNGPNRLVSQVTLHWAGTDNDGYVTGFRISWGQDSLQAVQRLSSVQPVAQTDSTFLFNFSAGQVDTADIFFFVQAIDDKGDVDPTPAFLKIPVKNTPPTIAFQVDGLSVADTIWSVFSFPYTFSDPDGFGNIDSILIKVNDGAWETVPKNINFISLVPTDPGANGPTTGIIYEGANLATQTTEPQPVANVLVKGLVINGRNRVYLKIKDLAGAFKIDSTIKQYYFKQKTSDLLVVDAYKGDGAFIGDSIYYNLLAEISPNPAVGPYDRYDLVFQNTGGVYVNHPKFWNATFYLLNKLYKRVYYYSDEFSTVVGEVPLLLSFAAPSFNQYLRFNGKVLISAKFPDYPAKLATDDPIFTLLPIDSISTYAYLARMRRLVPIIPKQSAFDTLYSINQLGITGVDVFYPKPGVDTLYVVPENSFTSTFLGPPGLPIALRTRNAISGKSNLIFFGMELSYLSGRRNALKNTFSKIFYDEFNW